MQSEAGETTIPRIWICGKWDLTCGRICTSGEAGLQATIGPTVADLVPLMVQFDHNVRHSVRYHGAQIDQCVLGKFHQHHGLKATCLRGWKM